MADLNYQWLEELKTNIPDFLKRLAAEKSPGYFHYSLSGDLYLNSDWGLGNTVFASKILYMINDYTGFRPVQMADVICKFQRSDGFIVDSLIKKKSLARRIKNAIFTGDWNNLNNRQTELAETRQAFAALESLNARADNPFLHIPYDENSINNFILGLDWKLPWGAASHVSHLLFFLAQNKLLCQYKPKLSDELIDYTIEIMENYQQQDGSWHLPGGEVSIQQRVNGAMKMLIGFNSVDHKNFKMANELIDLCLLATSDKQACDNFNIIYVLYTCSKQTDYRQEEIEMFAHERIKIYQEYYWPEFGGFSFFKKRSNDFYYGARITKGLPEPDIHGTVLFLWGIVLISNILRISDKYNFRVPIT